MWMFNPGNPVRGTVKFAEEDVGPDFSYMRQVSLPPFYRMTVPADSQIAQEWPSAGGEILMQRMLPNAFIRQGQSLHTIRDPFEYIQIAKSSEVPVIFDVIAGPAFLYTDTSADPDKSYNTSFDLTVGGTQIVQTSLTQAEVVELFESESGVSPLDVKSQSWRIDDFWPSFTHDQSHTFQLLRVVMPPETHLLVSSAVGYSEDYPTVESPGDAVFTLLENSGNLALWVVAWTDSLVSIRSRPYMQFAHVAIFDVIEPAVLPDAMRAYTLEGHEIMGSGDSVIRGADMGKLTVHPGWL